MKTLIRLLAGLSLAATCLASFAQTQTVPTPASSVDRGGRAVIAITMPPPGVTPTDVQRIAADTRDRGWSSYFVGTQKCINTFPGGRPAANCFRIQSDASILLVAGGSFIPPLTPGTNGYTPVTVSVVDLPCFNAGTAIVASPTSSAVDISFGRVPTDWTLSFASINGRQCDTGGF